MNLFEDLKNTKEPRLLLQKIRDLKDDKIIKEILKHDENLLLKYLEDKDPKVRRLAHGLIAKAGDIKYLPVLVTSYNKEEQNMIKASMVKNISSFDLDKNTISTMTKHEQLIDGQSDLSKHDKEELLAIRQLLKKYRSLPKHTFKKDLKPVSMILTMPSGHQEALMDELVGFETKKVSLGVQVKTNQIDLLMKNRLFTGIYFPLCKLPDMTLETLTSKEFALKIVNFLNRVHEEDFSYRMRVDMEDMTLMKKVANGLEIESDKKLQNYPNDYEVEVRIRANKQNEAIVYLKLSTLEDHRFDYRQKVSSSALSPATAALIQHYLQDYIDVEGQIIDPLCNDGTLLIERYLLDKPHFMMGLDISKDLLNMAKYNANIAEATINFIQRDVKTFTHQKKFTELVTQLPSVVKREDKDEVEDTYKALFKRIPDFVEVDGIVALYSKEADLINFAYKRNRKYLTFEKAYKMVGNYNLYIFKVIQN